jgi:hypothetical protein
MQITKSNIYFSLTWIRKLLLSKDFAELQLYIEKFNEKLHRVFIPLFPEPLWKELLHYFFMMELGSSLESVIIIVENNKQATRLIIQYDELCSWKNRLNTATNIGNLDYLPNDILSYISQKLNH